MHGPVPGKADAVKAVQKAVEEREKAIQHPPSTLEPSNRKETRSRGIVEGAAERLGILVASFRKDTPQSTYAQNRDFYTNEQGENVVSMYAVLRTAGVRRAAAELQEK
jgi:hypothetical protein